MRKIVLFFLPLALLLLTASFSHAQSRSSFKVADVKQVGANFEVTVDTNHFTETTKVQFFAHTATPAHSSSAVQGGKPIGEIDLAVGQSSHTLTVPKSVVDSLGLKPGETVHVSAYWPKWGHMWGTPNTAGEAHNAGTNFKIPNGTTTQTVEVAETFPKGMPLMYSKPLWKGAKAAKGTTKAVEGKPTNNLGVHADIGGLPHAGRGFAEAGSLLESEGKVGIRKKKQLRRTIGILKKMSKNPKLASKVLGEGWSVQYTATYTFADSYKDNKSMDLAKTEGGLRLRKVPGSGQPAQLNYKDPNGIRNGPDGVVMSRTERFIMVGDNPNLKELVRTDNKLNPMNNVRASGKDPAKFLNSTRQASSLSAHVRQAWRTSAGSCRDFRRPRSQLRSKDGLSQAQEGLLLRT